MGTPPPETQISKRTGTRKSSRRTEGVGQPPLQRQRFQKPVSIGGGRLTPRIFIKIQGPEAAIRMSRRAVLASENHCKLILASQVSVFDVGESLRTESRVACFRHIIWKLQKNWLAVDANLMMFSLNSPLGLIDKASDF